MNNIYYRVFGRAVVNQNDELVCIAETPEWANEIAKAMDVTHWNRWDEQDE
jgi:hypothetical protein